MCSSSNSNSADFPYEICRVDETINKKLLQDFTGERTGYVQVGPQKYFFPIKYEKEAQLYYNIEMRTDDVLVVSFPRSGTTLTQELVWMIGNDLNFKKAANLTLPYRFPYMEFELFIHEKIKEEVLGENTHSKLNQQLIEDIAQPGWKLLPSMDTPRFIKTHFPFSLLPKDWAVKRCKTIYVARHPKQVAVSYFYLNKLFNTLGFQKDFNEYWEYFENYLQPYMPYWSHVEEAWTRRNESNILFLFYEDIVNDMRGAIQKVANFLDKTLTDRQIQELEDHLSLENFRKNASVNSEFMAELKITRSDTPRFIRKGQKGSSDTEYNEELMQQCDKWIEENMQRTNIKFPNI